MFFFDSFLVDILVDNIVPILLLVFLFLILDTRQKLNTLRRKVEGAFDRAAPSSPPVIATAQPAAPPSYTAPAKESLSSSPPPKKSPSSLTLEQRIGARWFVWLGGLATALAGIFMVRYSIQAGLIGPGTRVALGAFLGGALIAVAEHLRRKAIKDNEPASGWASIPGTMVGAGVIALFAAFYSGFALYNLYSPTFALLLLVMVSLGAQILAYWHGPAVGLLGLIGAFSVPALVSTGQNDLVSLLIYLQIVLLGSLGLIRWIGVRWLSWAALAAAAIWPFLWMMGETAKVGDGLFLGLYTVATIVQFVFVPRSFTLRSFDEGWFPESALDKLIVVASGLATFSFVSILEYAGYDNGSIFTAFLLIGGLSLLARIQQPLCLSAILAALLALVMACAWPFAGSSLGVEPFALSYQTLTGGMPKLPLPAAFTGYLSALLILGLSYGVIGFLFLSGAARQTLWAFLSTAVPFLLLVISYGRLADYRVDYIWACIALGLAAAFILAAASVRSRQFNQDLDGALSIYAAGAVASLSLCFALLVHDAWLTIALSLQLPALGWIYQRLPVRGLRYLASAVAAVVLVRLAFNPFVLDYTGWGWTLYGYGVPALAFAGAWRLFESPSKNTKDDIARIILESGAWIFGVLLLMAQVRLALHGSIREGAYTLIEATCYTAVWLGGTVLLMRLAALTPRLTPRIGWQVLGLVAVGNIIIFHLLAHNPFNQMPPARYVAWPVFNVLLLAYALPIPFLVLIARLGARQNFKRLSFSAHFLSLFLGLFYLSTETYRSFGGFTPSGVPESSAQALSYTYSVVWLIYAAALLAVGLWRRLPLLRYGGLGLLMLTITKVFLVDMSDLEGLWRVASFLGLGLCLLGIGYIYQRFMKPPVPPQQ